MILTVTLNPTVDKSTSVDRVDPEHKLRCDAIKNLGGKSRALWVCGGAMGDLLRQLLDARYIDHELAGVRLNEHL